MVILAAVVMLAIVAIVMIPRLGTQSKPLNDAQITAFLHDDADPEGIVYAISQLGARRSKGAPLDPWVPELLRLASHPAEEVRHNVARLMAQDNSRPEFHAALLEMLRYQTILLRNTAALSLAAFGDDSGHEQVLSLLQPANIDAPSPGYVRTVSHSGEDIEAGGVVVRLQSADRSVEVLSPLSGRVSWMAVQDGDMVSGGSRLAVVEPGPEQMIVALRALEKIGRSPDLRTIAELQKNTELPAAVREQARITEEKIRQHWQ